jgi:predicted amidophosphoribosyltransferase
VKFLYKIWSGYDGFQPRRIPERIIDGKDVDLGWERYIDSVDVGHEVWVYFYGPHRYTPGVYVTGFVKQVHPDENRVRIRVRSYSTDKPLTDAKTSERIGNAVSVRNRQVFLFPEQWATAPDCTLHSIAESCKKRLCDNCPTWQGLPLIKPSAVSIPPRLAIHQIAAYSPAFWVIPSRCYLHHQGPIAKKIHQTSDVFYRFKVGEEELAYPLALGIYTNLTRRKAVDFDAVVPIPLSPDKAQKGEIHRTRLLGKELARLLGTRLSEVLSLDHPISKHKLRIHQGLTAGQFELKYSAALCVDPRAKNLRRVLLLDDVCTEGSTLRSAITKLRSENADFEVSVATAGQMILKSVVSSEAGLLA